MKHKWLITLGITVVILLVIVGLFLLFCVYAWNGLFGNNEIKKGFSPELSENLQTRYGITIPGEAKFMKGYNTGGQDNFVLLYFECPITESTASENHYEYIKQLLKLDPARYQGSNLNHSDGTDLAAELGGKMDYEILCSDISYTSIKYKIEGRKLLIRFHGWRPHRDFP